MQGIPQDTWKAYCDTVLLRRGAGSNAFYITTRGFSRANLGGRDGLSAGLVPLAGLRGQQPSSLETSGNLKKQLEHRLVGMGWDGDWRGTGVGLGAGICRLPTVSSPQLCLGRAPGVEKGTVNVLLMKIIGNCQVFKNINTES